MVPPQVAASRRLAPEVVARRPLREPHGWLGWLTTTDHKRIGVMYLVATFVELPLRNAVREARRALDPPADSGSAWSVAA
jgi:hypothetical protein